MEVGRKGASVCLSSIPGYREAFQVSLFQPARERGWGMDGAGIGGARTGMG